MTVFNVHATIIQRPERQKTSYERSISVDCQLGMHNLLIFDRVVFHFKKDFN